MPDPVAFSVNDHKPRGISRLDGSLSDQLLGQVVPEIRQEQIGLGQFVLYHCGYSEKRSRGARADPLDKRAAVC